MLAVVEACGHVEKSTLELIRVRIGGNQTGWRAFEAQELVHTEVVDAALWDRERIERFFQWGARKAGMTESIQFNNLTARASLGRSVSLLEVAQVLRNYGLTASVCEDTLSCAVEGVYIDLWVNGELELCGALCMPEYTHAFGVLEEYISSVYSTCLMRRFFCFHSGSIFIRHNLQFQPRHVRYDTVVRRIRSPAGQHVQRVALAALELLENFQKCTFVIAQIMNDVPCMLRVPLRSCRTHAHAFVVNRVKKCVRFCVKFGRKTQLSVERVQDFQLDNHSRQPDGT